MSRNKAVRTGSIFDNKIALVAFSLLVAIVAWTVVSTTQTTQTHRTISGVSVRVVMEDNLSESNLNIYGNTDFKVDVTVKGPSYMINASSFGEDDITVTASTKTVASPGSYNLPLTATVSNDSVSIESLSVSSVKAYFDETVTKTFSLTEEITEGSKYSLDAGLIRENPTMSAETIDITGPSKEISKISSVKAVVELNEKITSTEKYEAEIVYETDGQTLDTENIEIASEEKIYITVPVSRSGKYNTKVEFTNVPKDYRDKGIEYTITPSEVEVTFMGTSDTTVVNDDGTITVGFVDYSKINNEVNYIKIKNSDLGEEEVTFTVRIDASDLYKRWMEVPVDLSNFELPDNVTVNSTSVLSVQFIGPESTLKNIDKTAAYAVPNIEGVDLDTPGTYTVPAKIVLRTITNSWVHGVYQV